MERRRVLVIGGGLAGLAATTALACRGFDARLLESRNRLGGRAGSFTDPASGELVDTCQHVSMGCCTNFAHFCREVGIGRLLERQQSIYFMTPDRRLSAIRTDPLPAPWHLARSFLRAHFLTLTDKFRIAWGLLKMRARHDSSVGPHEDPPFVDWLRINGQTPRTLSHFWAPILTSALNESPERVGLRYARKVFAEAYLKGCGASEIEVPRVPLGRLYGKELLEWFAAKGVQVSLNHGVKTLATRGAFVTGAQLRSEETVEADWYIAAVPFNRLLDLLPETLVEETPYFANLRRLETSPITSVHLWYDRPPLALPHVVLLDCTGQWVFNRGPNERGEHYIQVVVSAARHLRGLGNAEIQRRIVEELAAIFPDALQAALRRARVVTEQEATFSAVPRVDA